MTTTARVTTFRTACAGARFIICVSGAIDAFDVDEPYTAIHFLNERAQPNPWGYNEHNFVIPSVCVWKDPATPDRRVFVALSENGEVVHLSPTQVHERIVGAGLAHADSQGWGYLNDIQQIGDHLYACGFSGQVYKREGDQHWVHMDAGLLQSRDLDKGQYFAQAINGPHERAIYLVGCEYSTGYPARADFWDGQSWRRLDLPVTAKRLTNIFVESEDRIWFCGDNGTLLMGNARDGFVTMNPLGLTMLITSVTRFQDRYYLAANTGLYQFDPANPNRVFRKVRTQLQPELTDANVVEAVDDVLWSIGPKDIARFDGTRWERFHHPDNPPIGGAASTAVP
ncbi:MAG: hypothetical protein ACM3VZ_08985 [Acidobacteriota bacterium]